MERNKEGAPPPMHEGEFLLLFTMWLSRLQQPGFQLAVNEEGIALRNTPLPDLYEMYNLLEYNGEWRKAVL